MRGSNWIELYPTFAEVDNLFLLDSSFIGRQKLGWNDGFNLYDK